ncbi:homoserine O-acetyltransferase/O-succinyltransferase family protein [Elioraea rosea]|uniref:homoserine O-acetyltransferase/O-succinyltransferase family protein n=1 Tax=Elioraea rosea TaxID=2492390 RepID=UPI001183AC37|nr:homoserine O-succinyltransferase [Elioraea rosea]
MPIQLPPGLPAAAALREEGIAAEDAGTAAQGSLRIALVNLMPDKPTTEVQFARLLGAAPGTVSLSLFAADGGGARRTAEAHLARFYTPFTRLRAAAVDGIIITGAPLETIAFDAVRWWGDLASLFDDAAAERVPVLAVCWAAMAAAWHGHGIDKQALPRKAFGLFAQTVRDRAAPLMQGIGPRYVVPVSRHAALRPEAFEGAEACVLASSPAAGVSIADNAAKGVTMVLDHLEYDGETLIGEFLRDRAAALPVLPPAGLTREARAELPWRPAGHLLMRNWLGRVTSAAAHRRPQDMIGWLLAPAREPAAAGELVLRIESGAEPLGGLIALAEAWGIGLAAFARHPSGTLLTVTLAVTTAREAAEELAARTLGLPGVREAYLRGPGHAGMAFRAAA